VALSRRVGGQVQPLGEPQTISVVADPAMPQLTPQQRTANVTYQDNVAKLQRTLTGALEQANNMRTRTQAIRRALVDAPTDVKLMDQAVQFDRRVLPILRSLRGDETLRGTESGSPTTIQNRVNSAVQGSRGLAGLSEIDGFLLDVRGNTGGYEPNILPTFLRGRWNAADYYVISRDGRRLTPPEYKPLPVALLVNSGTASNAEALALKFRAHAIGPIVGEATAGMASGGASAERLSDGSTLWFSERAIESLDGKTFEGRGVEPDVAVADRPAAVEGDEDAVIEAAIRALQTAPRPAAR